MSMPHTTDRHAAPKALPGEAAATPIPFLRVEPMGDESSRMLDALSKGHVGGDGPYGKQCSAILERTLGVPRALMVTSCTHALEICGILLNLGSDDEVIVPSFTFVSTANAFSLRGSKIVFADIRPDTLGMDENHLARLITPRTKAIVPMHYASVACEMEAIIQLADKQNICVIEDNAHSLYGKYKGRYLGTFGALATQSFDEMKNFTCGQGGALIINNPKYIERAEIIREKGTNRSRFFRGQVDKYTWVDVGSNYSPSDMLMGFLSSQLENRDRIQEARQRVWGRYQNSLRGWATAEGVQLPIVPPDCEQVYHLYYILLPSLDVRQRLIAHLKALGISALFHYQALHLSDMGKRYGGKAGDCPVTESVADRILRLPFYNTLTTADQDRVIEGVRSFKV